MITTTEKYLVWVRTEDANDELYRVATADNAEEVLDIIAGAHVPMSLITITSAPMKWQLRIMEGRADGNTE